MTEQFLSHLYTKLKVAQRDAVLLAVSGGLDSMVLLDLFRKAGCTLSVAHANFQLRGAESDADETFVLNTCNRLNIPFFSKRFETSAYAEKHGLSIQMAARELRYQWFDSLLTTKNFAWVATAHHFDDSVETMMIRWLHGAGADGLTGIPLTNGKIIRPLLFATRKEIAFYAEQEKIQWREDSSNATDEYLRNQLRHQVVPVVRSLIPSFEQNLKRGLRKAEGELAFFEQSFQAWKAAFCEQRDGLLRIQKKAFEGLSDPAVMLWRLLRDTGFSFDICEQVADCLQGQSGKHFLADRYRLVIDRAELIVEPITVHAESTLIEKGQPSAVLGTNKIQVTYQAPIMPVFNNHVAVLDAAKLEFPLQWRYWKAGDFFYPLGMDHKKKLSDFFIDNKISLPEKSSITVLESGGVVAWLVGYRIDDRFKLDEQTQSAIAFTLHKPG